MTNTQQPCDECGKTHPWLSCQQIPTTGAATNTQKLKTINGLNAYEILVLPDCPIKLPFARSMTQARIDFESLEDSIIEWYRLNKCPECNINQKEDKQ